MQLCAPTKMRIACGLHVDHSRVVCATRRLRHRRCRSIACTSHIRLASFVSVMRSTAPLCAASCVLHTVQCIHLCRLTYTLLRTSSAKTPQRTNADALGFSLRCIGAYAHDAVGLMSGAALGGGRGSWGEGSAALAQGQGGRDGPDGRARRVGGWVGEWGRGRPATPTCPRLRSISLSFCDDALSSAPFPLARPSASPWLLPAARLLPPARLPPRPRPPRAPGGLLPPARLPPRPRPPRAPGGPMRRPDAGDCPRPLPAGRLTRPPPTFAPDLVVCARWQLGRMVSCRGGRRGVGWRAAAPRGRLRHGKGSPRQQLRGGQRLAQQNGLHRPAWTGEHRLTPRAVGWLWRREPRHGEAAAATISQAKRPRPANPPCLFGPCSDNFRRNIDY